MTAILAALVAAATVAGVIVAIAGLIGPVRSLDAVVADLHQPRTSTDRAPTRVPWPPLVLGRWTPRIEADLAVCDRSPERWALDRMRWAGLGAGLGLFGMVVVPVASGGRPGPVGALIVTGLGAAAGWMWAVPDLHHDAESARRELRHAVAAYLELVTILLAGGSGPDSAMYAAVEAGRGPAFRHLRSALAIAQVRQEPPWAALGQLGRRLGVPELVDLGASMSLAGGGAQVRSTLATKAVSIRRADLAAVEARAQSRSETMALPVVLMFTGFLILLGYPALAALSGP
ncbi:MAG: type II secretion protein F [Acidimicrobiales bacterium]